MQDLFPLPGTFLSVMVCPFICSTSASSAACAEPQIAAQDLEHRALRPQSGIEKPWPACKVVEQGPGFGNSYVLGGPGHQLRLACTALWRRDPRAERL